ncbi:MAG TPA: flagellar basal body protein [Planctomycetota bacterium]|nr:flagellar basal body protein [Planctomycetota bacterium]
MLDRLFGGGSLRALEVMLSFASERQTVIAGNIANVSTPGYGARDLSESGFQAELDRAFAGQGRMSPSFGVAETGQNVDLELEMTRMVRNTDFHSTAAALLAHQFSLMREAISGRVN